MYLAACLYKVLIKAKTNKIDHWIIKNLECDFDEVDNYPEEFN